MTKTVNSGVRLTEQQFSRWKQIAKSLGVSKNRALAILIESAEIESRPSVAVGLNGRHSVVQPVENLG